MYNIFYFKNNQIFQKYGVSTEELFENDNNYFTTSPIGIYTSKDGRVYSKDEQRRILDLAQGSWFLMLVCCQSVHIWVCRTTTVSILKHGIFTNYITIFGVIVSIVISCLIAYLPALQVLLQCGPPPSIYIFVGSIISLLLLWGWSEMRKFIIRAFPSSCFSSLLKW